MNRERAKELLPTCLLDDMVASDGLEAVLEELTSIVRHQAFMSGIGERRNALYRVAHLLADAHDAAQEVQEEDY